MAAFEVRYDQEHFKRLEQIYVRKIEQLYLSANREAISIAKSLGVSYDPDKPFSFEDYPQTKGRVDKLFQSFDKRMVSTVNRATKEEWLASALKNDELVDRIVKNSKFKREELQHLYNRNLQSLAAFQKRKVSGMNLSDRVWKYSNQYKGQIEMGLDVGLSDGRSAAAISRDLREYLQNPDKLFRRVRDKRGELVLSQNAKKYHPGPGVYRSSYKNALRMTRTEVNMAYRTSDFERWQQLDFVVGIEVRRSNHVFACVLCDTLVGRYPKGFMFRGWHPQCYDDKSEVLTNTGWKLFENVENSDLIFSLNPSTRKPEWTGIKLNFKRWYTGKMVHFSNRSLDCLVTPEHEMVYVLKSNGSLTRTTADNYTKGKGAFYRGCGWEGEEGQSISIGSTVFPFDAFVQFMGYWLADGSLIRDYQVKIAQQDGDPNKQNIITCIERLGLKPGGTSASVDCYSKDLNAYLRQFGHSYDKYVPEVIKNASVRQIKLFLDAFISCDGHIKKAKSFVGSRGNVCTPSNDGRIYCTTSPRMASDIGEMILKIGKRPSYGTRKTAGKQQKFRNGTYTINHDGIVISECNALTATVFEKQFVDYTGYVYDLTLEKNAIMYVRRNGKCFWGSNCRCYVTTILSSIDEFIAREKGRMEGREPGPIKSVNEVNGLPGGFIKWISDHAKQIEMAKNKPYFILDNFKGETITKGMKGFGKFPIKPPKPIKTPEQKADIQSRWNTRQATNKYGAEIQSLTDEFGSIDAIKAYSAKIKTQIKAGAPLDSVSTMVGKLKHKVEVKKAWDIRKVQNSLSKYIPDPKESIAAYGLENVQTVYSAVEKKMAQFDMLPMDQKKKKLQFEIQWVGENKKYSTWKLALDAYQKQLTKVEYLIDKQAVNEAAVDSLSYAHKSKSPIVKKLAAEFNAMLNKDASIQALNSKLKELDDKVASLSKDAAAKAAKKLKNAAPADWNNPETYTKARKDSALWAKEVNEADKKIREACGIVWRSATKAERDAAYYYTHTYSSINEPLRGIPYAGGKSLQTSAAKVPHLTSIINKSSYDFDMWVQRGVGQNGFKGVFGVDIYSLDPSKLKSLVGREGTEKAFSSCAVAKGKGFSQTDVIYNIYCPKGTKMLYAEPFSQYGHGARSPNWDGISKQSVFGSEAEIIIQKNTRFRIIKAEYSRGHYYVDIEVIGQ